MTLRRKLATYISAAVVRRSSPATKDWAQASAQELASIENDWAALRWSLSSTSLLFQQRSVSEAPLTAISDVPLAADRLTKETANRFRALCVIAVFIVIIFTPSLVHLHNPVRRTGCLLFIASNVYLVLQAYVRRGHRLPPDAGLHAQAAHFRLELEREQGYHSGLWLWSRIVFQYTAMLVLMVAGAIAPPTHIYRALVWLAVVVAGVFFGISRGRRQASQCRRRILELDAVERGQ